MRPAARSLLRVGQRSPDVPPASDVAGPNGSSSKSLGGHDHATLGLVQRGGYVGTFNRFRNRFMREIGHSPASYPNCTIPNGTGAPVLEDILKLPK